jgi:hypothetical protein
MVNIPQKAGQSEKQTKMSDHVVIHVPGRKKRKGEKMMGGK